MHHWRKKEKKKEGKAWVDASAPEWPHFYPIPRPVPYCEMTQNLFVRLQGELFYPLPMILLGLQWKRKKSKQIDQCKMNGLQI